MIDLETQARTRHRALCCDSNFGNIVIVVVIATVIIAVGIVIVAMLFTVSCFSMCLGERGSQSVRLGTQFHELAPALQVTVMLLSPEGHE